MSLLQTNNYCRMYFVVSYPTYSPLLPFFVNFFFNGKSSNLSRSDWSWKACLYWLKPTRVPSFARALKARYLFWTTTSSDLKQFTYRTMISTVSQIIAVQNKRRTSSARSRTTNETASGTGLRKMCSCFQGKFIRSKGFKVFWILLVKALGFFFSHEVITFIINMNTFTRQLYF